MSDRQQHFDYLEALRDTGAVNMFGAGPYLAEAFGLTPAEARKSLADWMANR